MSMSMSKKATTDGACIWLVQGHDSSVNSRGWLPFEADPVTEDLPPFMMEDLRRNRRGAFLPQSAFPRDNYPRRGTSEHKRRIPQLFSNGFFFVRSESAAILREFDLGQGALYPTRLWHPDRKTPVPGEYFFLSQGNRKDAFLLEQSPEAARVPGGLWRSPPNPVHNQLCFSRAALEGPDIWWDPKIADQYFISNRLAKALKQVKLARDWMLLRCPVL